MKLNNELLHDFINCQYKSYQKSKKQTGCVSEYEILFTQLKQNQINSFEKDILQIKNPFLANFTFNNRVKTEGIVLNSKFTNENIDLILDGVEFKNKKKII